MPLTFNRYAYVFGRGGKKICGRKGNKRGCGKSREIGGQSVVRVEKIEEVKIRNQKSVAGKVTKIVRA